MSISRRGFLAGASSCAVVAALPAPSLGDVLTCEQIATAKEIFPQMARETIDLRGSARIALVRWIDKREALEMFPVSEEEFYGRS